MSLLQKQLSDASKALETQFMLTSTYKNPNTNGAIKEDLFREEIEGRLSGGIKFGKGEIIDSKGGKTGEQDIVGYDRHFMPLFQGHGEVSTFFAESVFCCIEAKSHLDKDAIIDSNLKFQKIRSLQRKYSATSLSEYQKKVIGHRGFSGTQFFGGRQQVNDIPRIVTGIICPSSLTVKTVEEHLKNFAVDADLVCVLGVGTWGRRWDENSWQIVSKVPELAYYSFVIYLHELMNKHLNRHIYATVSLENYL